MATEAADKRQKWNWLKTTEVRASRELQGFPSEALFVNITFLLWRAFINLGISKELPSSGAFKDSEYEVTSWVSFSYMNEFWNILYLPEPFHLPKNSKPHFWSSSYYLCSFQNTFCTAGSHYKSSHPPWIFWSVPRFFVWSLFVDFELSYMNRFLHIWHSLEIFEFVFDQRTLISGQLCRDRCERQQERRSLDKHRQDLMRLFGCEYRFFSAITCPTPSEVVKDKRDLLFHWGVFSREGSRDFWRSSESKEFKYIKSYEKHKNKASKIKTIM